MSIESKPTGQSDSWVQKQILGEYYFRKGQLKKALQAYKALSKHQPDQYTHHYYVGKIYYRLGKVEKAIFQLERVLAINPLHRQTLLLLHHSYSRTKDYDKALACVLDLYIMAKEIKDTHLAYYEKRIRTTSRKMENFTPEKKTVILKERIHALKTCLDTLEANHPDVLMDDLFAEDKASYTDQMIDEATVIAQSSDYEQEWNNNELQDFDEDQYDEIEDESTDPRLNQLLEQSMEGYVINDKTQLDSLDVQKPASIKRQPIIFQLQQIPFLRKLNPAQLEKMKSFTSLLTFKPGDWIFQEKDPVFGFFILVEGQVQMVRSNQTLWHQEAMANLDEDDFFRVGQRTFGVQCTETCTALFFNKAGYQNLFQRQPELVISFLWYFAQSIMNKIHRNLDQLDALTLPAASMEELIQNKERSNLRTLNESEIQTLSSLFESKVLKKNDVLYSHLQAMDCCFIVLEGQVTLSHPKHNPIIIQPNEVFAELTLGGPNYFHGYDAHISSDQAKILSLTRKQLSLLNQFQVHEQRFLADLLVRILSNKNKELRDFLYKSLYLNKRG